MPEAPQEGLTFEEWLEAYGFEDAFAQLEELEKEVRKVYAMGDEDFINWFRSEWQLLHDRIQRSLEDKPDCPFRLAALEHVESLALDYYTQMAASDDPRMLHRAKQHGERAILAIREILSIFSKHTNVSGMNGYVLNKKLDLAKTLSDLSLIDIAIQLSDVSSSVGFEDIMEQLASHPEVRFKDGFPYRRLEEALSILAECTDDEKYFVNNVTDLGDYHLFKILSTVAYIYGEENTFNHIAGDVELLRHTSDEFEELYQRCINGPDFLRRTKTVAPTVRLVSPEHQEKTTLRRCMRSIDPIIAQDPQKLEEYNRVSNLTGQIIDDESPNHDTYEAQCRSCLEQWQALAERDGMRFIHLSMISHLEIALYNFIQTHINRDPDSPIEQLEQYVALVEGTHSTISAAIDSFESASGEKIEDYNIANCFILSILFISAAEVVFNKTHIRWLQAGLSRPASINTNFIVSAVQHEAIRPYFQKICKELQSTFRRLSAFYRDKIFICTRGDGLAVFACAIFRALSENDLEHARQLNFHLGRFMAPSSEA